jgi:hypothetical protein
VHYLRIEDGRMYLLLLAFGGILAVAGIVLAAFGVSIHDHTFDTSVITPGAVAAVGGLLLIGLGLALRVLQRIERALDARPVHRIEPGLTGQPEPVLLHSPNPTLHPQRPTTIPAVTAPLASATEKSGQDALEKSAPETSPLLARLEASRAAAATETSPPVDAARPLATSVDLAVAQVDKLQAARRKNGAFSPRIAPRLDVGARSQSPAERPRGPQFDTLWPKSSQPGRAPAAAAPASEPEAMPEPAAETAQAPTPVTAAEDSVSVLKSGVVDGMAYTLYSDGSIEAQLPQGTLRFGSITELRNHIEQSA